MEFKGTKGKWEIDKTMGIVNSIDNIGDDVVCMAPDPICMRSLSNWNANALLISKAPELLEMLNDIKDYLGSDKREEVEQLIKDSTKIL